MNKEKFLERVKNSLEIENKEISLNDNFSDYSEMDSLGKLSLIAMLDEYYDVQMTYSEIAEFKTLENLFQKVCQKTPDK